MGLLGQEKPSREKALDKQHAEQLLKAALGDGTTSFRPDQWEAIDALVNQRSQQALYSGEPGWRDPEPKRELSIKKGVS